MFFDPSGRRWPRVLAAVALMLVIAVGAGAWLLPQATAPAWTQPLHQDPDYPSELLATADPDNVPVVGTEDGYAFARIALVKRVDGETVLADPFSDRIFRPVTEAEEATIGASPYAIERFGRPGEGQLMITFDDGPNPEFTPEILDVLEAEGVPATFFTIGRNVATNPEIVQRTVREGHMVGNHTMTHLTDWTTSDYRNREELIGTDRTLRAVTDYATRLFRVPEADPDHNPLALLQAQQLGYLHVDLDMDTRDWSYSAGEKVPLPELDGDGHIVLLHDGGNGSDRSATVAALRELIAQAKAKGYTFSTLEPILPEGYLPTDDADAQLADEATAFTVAAASVMPGLASSWLFWGWTGSMTVMSLLYIGLAVIGHRRRMRKVWRKIPDDDLPLVSVVLPVFNEEPVVARTLEALRASDYPNLEVIAVDDGSTDGTLAILQAYAATWPALQVLTQSNGGKSMASNHGIMASRGEIVVTLDGDTIFEKETIRMLARHFYDHDGARPVGAVAGHVKVGNRKNLWTAWQSAEYISGICINRMAEGVVGAISVAPGACAAWRKEALRRAGGYSHDTLAEDNDLTLSLQRHGYAIVQDNEAVAWTEAPMTFRGLAKQRLRWTYGNIQALWKNSDMLFRPGYGALGLVALPYSVLSAVMTILFLPFIMVLVAFSLASGSWGHVILYVAFVSTLHAVTSFIAIRMVKENPLHLLIVPVFRFVYEPMRIYVLYASLFQAVRGRMVGWYKPERTNSVIDLSMIESRDAHAQRV